MQVDINWISEKFRILNNQLFKGTLPTPRFITNYSNQYLGQCYCEFSPITRIADPSSYAITISNRYQRNEGDFLNTLLHEMIHLYFYAKRMPYVDHGREFQRMARSFDKYGFDVHTKSEVCTNLSPCIGMGTIVGTAIIIHRLSTFFHRSLLAFVLGMFLTNKDAMKVIFFFSKIGAEEAWTKGCHLWAEYHMTEHLLELLNLLIQLSVILFDYIRQLVSNIL